MADREINISASEIPEGFCQCGCGQRTKINERNHAHKGWVKGEYRRFVLGHCARTPEARAASSKRYTAITATQKGENHPRWKGGRTNFNGYIQIWKPEHPRASLRGYVFEHILVMEKAIGRLLVKNEVVHHRDGNPANNSIGNLIVFKNNGIHIAYHARCKAVSKK